MYFSIIQGQQQLLYLLIGQLLGSIHLIDMPVELLAVGTQLISSHAMLLRTQRVVVMSIMQLLGILEVTLHKVAMLTVGVIVSDHILS